MEKAKNSKPVTLDELLQAEKYEELLGSISFENGLKLLEELVSKVESGALSLDKAIGSYERGAKIIKHLRVILSGAEEKLKTLQIKAE